MAGLEKWTDGFLPWLIFHYSWPSFQWNPHAPWPLLQEVHHLVFLFFAGHGGCCQIFDIWENRFLSYPLWKLICRLLGCVTTRTIYRWPALFLDMDIFTTLVTGYIWPGRWPSSRANAIYIASALEINLLQSLVDRLFNGHSVCLWKRRLVMKLFFACSRFPPLWIQKIAVLSRSLLYKELIGYDILLW